MEEEERIVHSKLKWRRRAVAASWLVGGVAFSLIAVSTPFVMPALRRYCLPYVPATPVQIEKVLSQLQGRCGSVVDLGSGDGRVVIEAALRGHSAVGYELNPWLVCYSRLKAFCSGVSHCTQFHCKDLWKADLSQHDTIIIFGVEEMMEPLGAKITEEASCTARVVACRFPVPGWTATLAFAMGPHSVWVYDNVGARF